MRQAIVKRIGLLSCVTAFAWSLPPHMAHAGETLSVNQASLLGLYKKCESEYEIPWTVLAAIDKYAELTKSKAARRAQPYYGFSFESRAWVGLDNPNIADVNPKTIRLFHGLGLDADGNGVAAPSDPVDRVTALAKWLDTEAGEDVETAIWELFQDAAATERIAAFARVFDRYGIEPKGNCFPVSKRYNFTVKHTFGAGRNWGGRRIHEGVDIFASYGTPVLACAYGYIEIMGWNRYGGWRIGIRDTNNNYYYYAHLSRFEKGLRRGTLLRPGQIIGYVGNTGYGPPGTSGKFPPHLHFGVYRDTGRHEWAFNPSPLLAQWIRQKQQVISPEGKHS